MQPTLDGLQEAVQGPAGLLLSKLAGSLMQDMQQGLLDRLSVGVLRGKKTAYARDRI